MLNRLKSYVYLLLLAGLASCSYTRHVPAGQALLMENKVEVQGGESGLKKSLQPIIRQRPNSRSLFGVGFRNSLMIYNWGDPQGNWFSRIWPKLGEAPVILDTVLAERTSRQMGLYLLRKGYFRNSVGYSIGSAGKKKADVVYYAYPGPRYRVTGYSQEIATKGLQDLVNYTSSQSLIVLNQAYDADVLDAEQKRLVNLFRNSGYFNFPRELIHFGVDTSTALEVKLIMYIDDMPVQKGDSIYTRPHTPYYLNNIYVDPQYSYQDELEPVSDTVFYNGYHVLVRGKNMPFKPRLMHDVIHFESGEKFEQDKASQTYRHISSLRIFRNSEIVYSIDSTATDSLKLNSLVRATPISRFNSTLEGQFTHTSGNYGISGSLSFLNRNLFRGGEILQLKLNGGIEAQLNTGVSATSGNQVFNTFEYGAEVSLNFPKFILPINTLKLLPKRMQPTSRIVFGVSRQSRVEFDRTLFNLGLEYTWKETPEKTHTLNLLDINFTRLERLDLDFLNTLQFFFGLQSVFTSSTRYTFLFNEPLSNKTHRNYFRTSVELSGNLLNSVLSQSQNEEVNKVLGVGVSQFFRLDIDYRHYWAFNEKYVLAARFFAGGLWGYGNGQYVLPFEKFYFGGGTNDIRAWNAYRLGPGSLKDEDQQNNISIAPLKLLTSVELRFPIYKSLKGALFTDAGNVWFHQPNLNLYQGIGERAFIRARTVLNDFAVGSGFGLRYDFDFFIIRLDAAYPIRVPYPDENLRRWFVIPFNLNNLTYNIGINYPF